MHIVVSWDIKAEGEEWKALNAQLKDCLSGYSWVKPLTTLYIVKLDDNDDRQLIKDSLVRVCKTQPKLINLVISPLMQGGRYGGWLPKTMWTKIRERTED
jgi:hypothetical protein